MGKKRTIKLLFTGFWHPPTEEAIKENSIYKLLSKRWDITISSKPDFVIYSVTGFEHLRYNCVRIFYTGENFRPDFSQCDYAFSFDYPTNERNFRLPLYRLYSEYSDLLKPRQAQKIIGEDRKFCCFLVSNPGAQVRIDFYNLLSKYKPVDSGGKVLNNIGYQIGPDAEKISWLQGYKFSIAFENASYPGYTTEKLLHGLVANTVPIYWGNPLVARDFNPKTFINCHDFASFDEAVDAVIKVDQDPSLYKEYLNQPLLPDNIEIDDCKEENILDRFEMIFNDHSGYIPQSIKRRQQLKYLFLSVRHLLAKPIKPYYLARKRKANSTLL